MRQPFALWRQSVLFFRRHLAEGPVEPVWPEKRIVAKALVTARRPYCDAIDPTLELLNVTVGPGETQGGHEMRAPLLGPIGAPLYQQRLNAIHRRAKIPIGACPSR